MYGMYFLTLWDQMSKGGAVFPPPPPHFMKPRTVRYEITAIIWGVDSCEKQKIIEIFRCKPVRI